MLSIIEGVREYMAACPLLAEIPLKSRYIDWTSATANNYGIIVDSNNLIRSFISGGGKYEYNFFVQARLRAEDKKSLENAEWVERMEAWCREQTAAKNFPAMPKGCTPTKLSAENGSLFERDKTGNTGLYQIQFKLSYIKKGS